MRPKMGTIYFTSLLDYIAFATIIPLLPILFLNSSLLDHYSIEMRYFLLGALYAIYPLAQILSNPILGAFSDRISRKAIFLVSYIGDGVGYSLFAIGILQQEILWMFLGFFIAGLTGCNVAMSNAYIADASVGETKMRRFIVLNILLGVAFILGPILCYKMVEQYPLTYCFAGSSLICLFNALLIFFRLDSTILFKRAEIPSLKTAFDDFKSLDRQLLQFICSLFFLFFGWYFFIKFFQVFLINSNAFEEHEIFYTLSYCGFCMIGAQGLFSLFAKRAAKNKKVVILFITLLGFSILSLAFVHTTSMLLVNITFFSACYSLLSPSLVYLVSEQGGVDSQGKIMGLYQSVQALAKVMAPLLMGLTLQIWWKLPLFVSSAFIFSSLLLFIPRTKVPAPAEIEPL